MKKLFILIMVLIMLLSVMGCSSAPSEEIKNATPSVEEVQISEETTEPVSEPTVEPEIIATNTVIDYIENNGVFIAELKSNGISYVDDSVTAVLSTKDGSLVFSMVAGEKIVEWNDMSLEEFHEFCLYNNVEKINVYDVDGSMFNYFDIEIIMDPNIKKADGMFEYIIYDRNLKTYEASFSFDYATVLSNENFEGIIESSTDGFNTEISMANEELQKIVLLSLECMSRILNENQVGVTLDDLGWT